MKIIIKKGQSFERYDRLVLRRQCRKNFACKIDVLHHFIKMQWNIQVLYGLVIMNRIMLLCFSHFKL